MSCSNDASSGLSRKHFVVLFLGILAFGATYYQNKTVLKEVKVGKTQLSLDKSAPSSIAKPHLILHIGPSKTGTTTIQDMLKWNRDQLLQDNYGIAGYKISPTNKAISQAVYGRLVQSGWACWNDNVTSTEDYHLLQSEPCWQALRQELDQGIASQGHQHNMIVSDEAMSQGAKRFMYRSSNGQLKLSMFAKELTARFNVKIVLVYRRYYEWLLSAHKEQNSKIFNGNKRKWPTGGRSALRNTWPALQKWMQNPNSVVDNFHYQYPDRNVHFWQQAGFENDSNSSLYGHFVCSVVPDAPRACEATLQRPQELRSNSRDVETTIYDQVVCRAKKLFGNNATDLTNRQNAANQLKEYHQTTLGRSWTDLPLKCPSTLELEGLLNMSLAKEKELVPDFYHRERHNHIASFWKLAIDKKAYCSVDLDRLFQGKTSWEDLLSSLKAST